MSTPTSMADTQAAIPGQLGGALRTLDHDLTDLLADLGRLDTANPPAWSTILRRQLLPALQFEVPVVLATICGGGSTGKSTLFNMLSGRTISPAGFRAGLTQRIVLCGHPGVLAGDRISESLLSRFGATPERWERPEDATHPGPPLVITSESILPRLMVLDTPDFDTGEGTNLPNRQLALPALQTSEILIYTFTNAIYNNTANSVFLQQILGAIGGRETILVYRVSRVLSEADALAHLRKVATTLYPQARLTGEHQLPEQVLACYRIHESDQVALGKAFPELIPVAGAPPLLELLDQLDVPGLKRRVLARELKQVSSGAKQSLAEARLTAAEVQLYRQVLDRALLNASKEALKAFPQGEAVALMQRLWRQSSPAPLKVLRAAGAVVASPARLAWQGLRITRDWMKGEYLSTADAKRLEREALEQDLLESANRLRSQVLEGMTRFTLREPADVGKRRGSPAATLIEEFLAAHGISGDLPKLDWQERISSVGITVRTPATLGDALHKLERIDWPNVSRRIRDEADKLTGLTPEIERRMSEEILKFRENMSGLGVLRETFFSSLAVLPPVIGVAYVLSTGDPATGGTLAIHLQSALGLNDLWAVMAIPASSGLTDVDRRQLSALLQPIIQAWFEDRIMRVRDLIRELILAPVEAALEACAGIEDPRFEAVENALTEVEKAEKA